MVQVLEIEGHHAEVEVRTDRIIGEDHVMSMIIEITLEETFFRNTKLQRSKF